MKPPENYYRVVGRKKYSVKTSTLIAHDAFWDGNNWERSGRNRFLYRTPRGNYFVVTLTQWQGEFNSLEPVDQETAISLYETDLTEHTEEYETAFPGVEVTDA